MEDCLSCSTILFLSVTIDVTVFVKMSCFHLFFKNNIGVCLWTIYDILHFGNSVTLRMIKDAKVEI